MRNFVCILSLVLFALPLRGENILRDSTFQEENAEGGLSHWELRGDGERLSQPGGHYELQLEISKPGQKSLWAQSGLKLKKKEHYVLTVYFKAEEGTSFSAYIEAAPGNSQQTLAHKGTGKWERLYFPFRYNADTPAKCVLRGSGHGKILIKEPQIILHDRRLDNGDFSQGLEKWKRLAGRVALSKQKTEHGNAMELMSVRAGTNAAAEFEGIQLFSGNHYLLTYEVKGTTDSSLSDSTRASWFRAYPTIGGKPLAGTDEWLDCFAEWQRKQITFKAEEDCVVQLVCELRAPGKAWFDNFQLQEVEIDLKPISILLNPPASYRNAVYSTQGEQKSVSGIVRLELPGVRQVSLSLAGKKLVLKAGSNEIAFTLPVPKRHGSYPLTATAYDAKGRTLGQSELGFTVYPPAKREVAFRDDNVMLVDGKPFFPLVSWSVRGTWSTEEKAATLEAAGFNAWRTPAADFEIAARHGLFTFLSVAREFPLQTSPATALRREQQEAFLSQLAKIAAHPALLGYFTSDEPAWCGKDPAAILENYEVIRRIDPYKPIWLNEAPRGRIQDLRKYSAACDIYGIDIYPIPDGSHSGMPDKTMASVGKYTDLCRNVVENRKPIWMALQGFSWGEINRKPPIIYPTHEENRFMAYNALLHGATGLTWWGINWRVDNREFFELLGQTVREIRSLSSVLVAPRVSGELRTNRASLRAMVRRHKGINYYVVINESGEKLTADFIGKFPRELTVLFEDRKLKTKGNKFRDSFKPYDVHVYSESSLLPAPLPLPELDLSEYRDGEEDPGNEVVNADFSQLEFNTGILTPAEWKSRPDSSGALVENPEHPGNLLLKQLPPEGETAFWIGSLKKIEIWKGYECTARVKADKGTSFRVYVERSEPKFQGFGSDWQEGTGEWQEIHFEFTYTIPGQTPYVVLQSKGTGACYAKGFKVMATSGN